MKTRKMHLIVAMSIGPAVLFLPCLSCKTRTSERQDHKVARPATKSPATETTTPHHGKSENDIDYRSISKAAKEQAKTLLAGDSSVDGFWSIFVRYCTPPESDSLISDELLAHLQDYLVLTTLLSDSDTVRSSIACKYSELPAKHMLCLWSLIVEAGCPDRRGKLLSLTDQAFAGLDCQNECPDYYYLILRAIAFYEIPDRQRRLSQFLKTMPDGKSWLLQETALNT